MSQCKLQVENTYQIIDREKQYNIKMCWRYLMQQGKLIYGGSFTLSAHHKTVYYKLLVYAIRDEQKMEQYNLDPRKGILLMGASNTGKTAIMRLVKPFFLRKMQYDIKTCRALSHEFSHKGFEMTGPLLCTQAKPIVIDNLGQENIAKHFGYSCDIIQNIVEHYYEQRYDMPYPKLHCTTMLSPSEIEKRYGITFRRMLTEMFNVIVCEG